MQTIKIDLSKKLVYPVILAQQGDVGRKIKLVITDDGEAYQIPAGTNFSVWYSGDSGSGNYTHIGTKSAFEVSGNTVTVELITQMLTNAGKGDMTIVMHGADGTQIGSLQLPYWTEGMPGAGSEGAQQYYTAFQQMVKEAVDAAATFKTDTTLSEAGKAADAAATGATLAKKAPAGYGLGGKASSMQAGALSELTQTGWYCYGTSPTDNPCSGYSGLLRVEACDLMTVQTAYVSALSNDGNFNTKATRQRISGEDSFGQWEWENPPMTAGTPYRTTERYNGKPVYTKLVNIGALPSSASKYYSIGIDPNTYIIVDSSVRMQTSGTYTRTRTQDNMDYCFDVGSDGNYAMIVETTANFSNFTCDLTVKYIRK